MNNFKINDKVKIVDAPQVRFFVKRCRALTLINKKITGEIVSIFGNNSSKNMSLVVKFPALSKNTGPKFINLLNSEIYLAETKIKKHNHPMTKIFV